MSKGSKTGAEFLKFVLVGGVSFIVHNVVYLLLIHFGVHPSFSYTMGYASWMIVNFILSNYITFNTTPSLRRAIGFAVSSLLYYIIQMCGFWLCRWLQLPDIIITPLVYTIAFPLNFLMVRFVLRRA